MARIAGIDIPKDKQARIALTYIYGVGPTTSRNILEKAQVGEEVRMKDLMFSDMLLTKDRRT